jgi:hypothetical protein
MNWQLLNGNELITHPKLHADLTSLLNRIGPRTDVFGF